MKLSNSAKLWIARIVSAAYGLLAVPGAFLAVSTAFLFDAPGSETSPLTNLFAWSIDMLPLVLLVSCVGGLVCAFGNRAQWKARLGKVLFLLPPANFLIIIAIIVLLMTLCGGNLVCHL